MAESLSTAAAEVLPDVDDQKMVLGLKQEAKRSLNYVEFTGLSSSSCGVFTVVELERME
jgi:hypothetical protein